MLRVMWLPHSTRSENGATEMPLLLPSYVEAGSPQYFWFGAACLSMSRQKVPRRGAVLDRTGREVRQGERTTKQCICALTLSLHLR